MTRLAAAVLLTAAAVAAPVPKVVKKQDDSSRLEGRWASVTLDAGGGKGAVADDTYRLEFKGGKLLVTSTKFRWKEEWKAVTLDPATTPKVIDITSEDGSVCKGIYKFDGDDLVWCHSTNIGRPDQFASADSGWCCFVLRRAEKE